MSRVRREIAIRNVRVLTDLVREGYRIVCSEPTAALMLSQDYLDLLDDTDTATVAANTVELTTFLGELHAAGRLHTDFHRLDLTLGHHVPCHLKALRGQPAGPRLLALFPGMRVHTIDVGCSGMAGTWGMRAASYATSLAAGAAMFAELNRPGVLFGSTECSTCRMQMQQGSGTAPCTRSIPRLRLRIAPRNRHEAPQAPRRAGERLTMIVKVMLFAAARELTGRAAVELELPPGATVATLRAELARREPALAGVLARCVVAVNYDFAEEQQGLAAADEVAIIPPVSGG